MPTPKHPPNSEQFEQQARPYVREHRGELAEPTFADLRQTYYFFKLIDSLWFEGNLPDDPDKSMAFTNNPDWPNSVFLPPQMNGIQKLSESELRYICGRLEVPAWVKKHRAETRTFNLTSAFIQTIMVMLDR